MLNGLLEIGMVLSDKFSCLMAMTLWALLKYCFWLFIFAIRSFQTSCMLTGSDGMPGQWIVPDVEDLSRCSILWGNGGGLLVQ